MTLEKLHMQKVLDSVMEQNLGASDTSMTNHTEQPSKKVQLEKNDFMPYTRTFTKMN